MTEPQLRELLHRATDDIDVGIPPSFDDLAAAPSSRRHWHTAWPLLAGAASIAAVIVVLLTVIPNNSVSDNQAANANPTPYDTNAEMRPDLMNVEPSTAFPAEYVSLTFPEKSERGGYFVLEAKVGETWDYHYGLVSDRQTGVPQWQKGGPLAMLDIGFADRGPDQVVIPPTTPPGEYRVCTANAGDNFCTPINISKPLPLDARPTTAFACGSHALTDDDVALPTPGDIDFALVCPFGGGSPLFLSAGSQAFDSFLGALALPDEDPSLVKDCATPGNPTIVLQAQQSTFRLEVPVDDCGFTRPEVSDALKATTPEAAQADYLDPLTMSLEFGEPSGAAITVSSGGDLPSEWTILNNSGEPVTDPACNIASARYGLVPIDEQNVELPWGAVVDCGGNFEMTPGFRDTWTGPGFRAVTPQGDPLPSGQYLAVVEIEGLSQRITYPVTVTE